MGNNLFFKCLNFDKNIPLAPSVTELVEVSKGELAVAEDEGGGHIL